MSDPVRLREVGDAFGASLLETARDDTAGEHVRVGVHAALGLGVAVGVATATSTAAAGAAPAVASAAATKSATGAVGLALAKLSGFVIAGVVLGEASLYVVPPRPSLVAPMTAVTHVASPTRPRGGGAPATAATAAGARDPREDDAAVQGAPAARLLPRGAAPAPGVAPVGGPAPAPASSTLVAELAPLDAARAALDTGNNALALDLLNRHDLEFPRGQLAPEALALRVEVYGARRDDSKVLELTRRFLSSYPDHPQAARMQAMAQTASGRATSPVPNP